MDFPAPPAVVSALTQKAEHGIYGYPLRAGQYEQSLVRWFRRRHGWHIKRDWIVSLSGVVPALNLALQAFSDPGDRVIIQPPVYYPFSQAVKNNGRQLIVNPLSFQENLYRIDFQGLRRALDQRCRILIFCSPHNPVGRVWREDELRRLSEICIEHDLLVISDEIHSDIVLAGYRHIPLASLSNEMLERTVTCVSPSKTFNLAGLTTANVIISHEKTRERFQRSLSAAGGYSGNVFGLSAGQTAYESGEEWLEQLLRYLAENYRLLEEFLSQRIPEVKLFPLEGTYLAWLDFRELGLRREDLNDLLINNARVWLDDGAIFGEGGSGFQRINIACPRSRLQEALSRMETALKSG